MAERPTTHVALALHEALERTVGDPAQAEMAQAMMNVFNAFVAQGFKDQPIVSQNALVSNADQAADTGLNPAKAEINLPTAERLVAQEKEAWKSFRGKDVEVSTPPQELFDVWTRANEQGITVFEAHFEAPMEFKQNSNYPGWKVKPEPWYWNQIKAGSVAKDAANLGGVWVLVDGSRKPTYGSGKQLYENDPFGPILARLRQEGKIAVPDSYKHVPETSRFAVTPDEREAHFNLALADILGVDVSQIGILKEIEFNVLGNMHHPEWGQANTSEWLDDKFGDGYRLIGGHSDNGGLARVYYRWSDRRLDYWGFRPKVVFPS